MKNNINIIQAQAKRRNMKIFLQNGNKITKPSEADFEKLKYKGALDYRIFDDYIMNEKYIIIKIEED